MPHRTLNPDEAAEYLHITPEDIRELVLRREIPFEEVGSRIQFRRREIDAWASKRILGFSHDHLHDYHRKTSARHHDLSARHHIIAELVGPNGMDPAVPAKTRSSVIRAMHALAVGTGKVVYEEELLDILEERERMGSTALSGGIAMMHPPHHDPYLFDDSFIVLGRALQPVPFGSPDGRTSNLFFLICCQDDRIHLHVLARLCMLCYKTDMILRLNEAADRHAMYEVICRAEDEVVASIT